MRVNRNIRPKIITAVSFLQEGRHFSMKNMLGAVNDSIKARSKALLVVHPLYSTDIQSHNNIIFNNPDLTEQLQNNDYLKFLEKLEQRIINTEEMVYVMSDEEHMQNVVDWLLKLNTARNIYLICTKKGNPEPEIKINDWSNDCPWHFLAEIFKYALISRIRIAGELAFNQEMLNKGCVFGALKGVGKFFYAELEKGLIYPGI